MSNMEIMKGYFDASGFSLPVYAEKDRGNFYALGLCRLVCELGHNKLQQYLTEVTGRDWGDVQDLSELYNAAKDTVFEELKITEQKRGYRIGDRKLAKKYASKCVTNIPKTLYGDLLSNSKKEYMDMNKKTETTKTTTAAAKGKKDKATAKGTKAKTKAKTKAAAAKGKATATKAAAKADKGGASVAKRAPAKAAKQTAPTLKGKVKVAGKRTPVMANRKAIHALVKEAGNKGLSAKVLVEKAAEALGMPIDRVERNIRAMEGKGFITIA